MNSLRASSEEVVTAILPPALSALFDAAGADALSSTLAQPLRAMTEAVTSARNRTKYLLR